MAKNLQDLNFWIIVRPDVTRPIGGVKQIHRLAEAINASGSSSILVQDDESFHPGWFNSNVNTISFRKWCELRDSKLSPESDYVIIPETYLCEFKSIASGLPVIVFNQNVSYSFGLHGGSVITRPSHILRQYSSPQIKHVFCVSRYDYNLLCEYFGLGRDKVSLLINGIETDICKPAKIKKRQIAFMARKNKLDAIAVTGLISCQPDLFDWRLVEISDCKHDEVIAIMKKSLMFLSFGHPEGFGLPVAEAMACGCCVVGYDGLGGRELFDIAHDFNMARQIPVGDWNGFLDNVKDFTNRVKREPLKFSANLLLLSSRIRDLYSYDSMQSSVVLALGRL